MFDLGDGRVLRRYRTPAEVEWEGDLMRFLSQRGYPVPAVHDASGRDLVIDRVPGPTMLAAVAARPWRVRRYGRLLADLHRQLHAIPAPEWAAPRLGGGSSVVHMDLHPMNVLLSPGGPIVIDWSNAGAGRAASDVVYAYVLMATASGTAVAGRARPAMVVRRAFLSAFQAPFHPDDLSAELPAAVERWLSDPNSRPEERAAARRLLREDPFRPTTS